jgi:ABC-type Zn uptake system ZnuABC Zn-binding protein ZnuA
VIVKNTKIKDYDFLRGMYNDGYFPDFLVDKVKTILVALCEEIEKENPQNPHALLTLTHSATEKINALEEEFDENDSELETVAREVMGADFEYIVRAYGFTEIDIEDVIEPREW